MIKFFLLIFLITANACFAQTEDIVVGGEAHCILKGKTPLKKFVADGNRLLLLQSEGITKGSIILQLISQSEDKLIDINILGLLGEVTDVDLFLSGKTLIFESDDSDLNVTVTSNGKSKKLTNLLSTEEKGNLSGKVKVTSSDESSVNGRLTFEFDKTSFNNSVNDKNGKAKLVCRLIDVPIEIKELEF